MKKQMKYYVLGLLLFLLLNIIATRLTPSVQTFEVQSDTSYLISQNEATQNSINLLYNICSSSLRKAISIDNQAYNLKNTARPLMGTNDPKSKVQSSFMVDELLYPYLHLDGIVYYVYTLEKIVI